MLNLQSPHLTEIHKDCVGGVMGLGDSGNNLANVGAESIKSCAHPVAVRTRAEPDTSQGT